MSYKVSIAPQITLGSKLFLQFMCGYPAPTPFPSPAGRPLEAIMPKQNIVVEGAVPPELVADVDGDGLPAFIEAAMGTDPFNVDGRMPATTFNLGTKQFQLQVQYPTTQQEGLSASIQVGDGLNTWREAEEGADYEFIDLGNGDTQWSHDGVTYRVARNAHPLTDHANAFLRLVFTAEGE